MTETSDARPEPPDHHVYYMIMLDRRTLDQLLRAVRFYESLLEQDINSVHEDPELSAVLDEETLDSYSLGRGLTQARRIRERLEQYLPKTSDTSWRWTDVSMSHETVRFLKSVEILYLRHLRRKRDRIASNAATSKALLEALDKELAKLEEKIDIGVFRGATPYPLAVEQLPDAPAEGAAAPPTMASLIGVSRPRPVILESIEIRDSELRRRCLDLFAQFHNSGEHDRLDTVVGEATRILEDRLRTLAGADAACSGVDLAAYAFRPPGRLGVSDVQPEQEAAHLLYRGVFGFVRNSAHHRLLGDLQPERVLQIVGMVDYLISVAEAAQRRSPTAEHGEDGAKAS